MKYWQWILKDLRRKLWWQTVLFGLLGLITALAAMGIDRLFQWKFPFEISRSDVSTLLNIIASSMLAVTTFSLGAMTTAFGGATSNVTPRATLLLMEDRVTHSVLSSFIGTFVFSIVALIVLSTGAYGPEGRAVLFGITVIVIALIVAQLLRWVNHLLKLGRVGSTIDAIEAKTAAALTQRLAQPYLGAHPWWDAIPPEGAKPLYAERISYIQFIDMHVLSEIAERANLQIWLPRNAGSLTYPDTVIAWIVGPSSPQTLNKIREQFIFATVRSFEQDPRFGLSVMAEVGSRALSQGINDSGTALDVLVRLTRLMALWAQGRQEGAVAYPSLHLNPLRDEDLFDDAFSIMARDGAHMFEIQLRLHKSLRYLQSVGSKEFRAAAGDIAQIAFARTKDNALCALDHERLAREGIQ